MRKYDHINIKYINFKKKLQIVILKPPRIVRRLYHFPVPSSDFLSHSRSEESGLWPSYCDPWERKRATEGKGCSLSLGFWIWRGECREENVLRASFFASCALTSKGALRPRRHSGRKAGASPSIFVVNHSDSSRTVSIRSEEGYEPGFKCLFHCSWSEGTEMVRYAYVIR
ncbi:hypothetical protein M9H77_29499 [Catharanthus roseus]|uniref:Uncharacterized protein n=1 Tax=Catharanthus roseus TaxID=4058 RepID=A0ACB9ZVW9_CATRO|nr:hypothetical protein M9H77_29499 [Catharanthus roseus]